MQLAGEFKGAEVLLVEKLYVNLNYEKSGVLND